MSRNRIEIFLSYSGKDSFEAGLLQFAIEALLGDLGVKVWTYERDQAKSERQIGKSLKLRIQNSVAAIFLASPSTFNAGAAQWMELAYADAFDVPIFVLLHQMTFKTLRTKEEGVPTLWPVFLFARMIEPNLTFGAGAKGILRNSINW